MSDVSMWARKGRIMKHGIGIIDAADRMESSSFPPLSPRTINGQFRMALYNAVPDLHVSSALLPDDLDGIYCLDTDTILIDRRITWTRKRCTLIHELVHRKHGDDTSQGCNGCRMERRCRMETARMLVNPMEYATAEYAYGGNAWNIADDLNVTVDVIHDYRILLRDTARA